jgi:hypothetical protein
MMLQGDVMAAQAGSGWQDAAGTLSGMHTGVKHDPKFGCCGSRFSGLTFFEKSATGYVGLVNQGN